MAGERDAILATLWKAIGGMTELTIETVLEGDPQRRMHTRIDLVDGDIKNTIHQDFVTGDLKSLRDFHEAQVHKGQEIVKNNVAALKALLELVVDMPGERREG